MTVYFSKMTARISKQIFKNGFEIMSRNLSKSTKLGILDFGMTGPYHKIGNFLISVSTPTPKFMLGRVYQSPKNDMMFLSVKNFQFAKILTAAMCAIVKVGIS